MTLTIGSRPPLTADSPPPTEETPISALRRRLEERYPQPEVKARDSDDRVFDEFWRALKGWPWWSEAQRQAHEEFSEGGGIEHVALRADGAFVQGVAIYADLEFNMVRLKATRGERVEAIVRHRWERDLTSRQIADTMRISLTTVTEGIRDGTTRLAEFATRLHDCRERVYARLDEQKAGGREFA